MPKTTTHTKPTRRTRAAGRRPAQPPKLTAALARTNPDLAAALAETRVRADNPLRRIQVTCCLGWRRDADAAPGTWVWCAEHADWARVIDVAE